MVSNLRGAIILISNVINTVFKKCFHGGNFKKHCFTDFNYCGPVFFKIALVKTFFEYSVDYIWNQDDRSSEIGNHIPYPYSWLQFQSQFWILSAMKKLTAIKNHENLVKLFLLEDLIKIDSLKYLLIESCNCTENSFFLNFEKFQCISSSISLIFFNEAA